MDTISVPELEGCIVETTTEFARPVNIEIYEYWLEICEKTPDIGPQNDNFALTDIIECAPYMLYKDIIDSGYDFRNRFWGTELVRAFSLEATGKTFRDYYEGKALKQVLEVANFVISRVHSVKMAGKLQFVSENKTKKFEAISLPLFDENGEPSRVVGAYSFF